jgi:hypothetical protein
MTLDKTTVFQACDTLLAQGFDEHALTNAALRQALGGRGSFSTLAPLLREWKDARRAGRASTPVPVPEGLGAQSMRMLDTLWTAALAAARADATRAVTRELEEERVQAAEALAELARLEDETARLREEATTAREIAEAERHAAAELREALGGATERAAQAEARAAEERAAREALGAQLAAAREEAAELRGTLKVLQQPSTR